MILTSSEATRDIETGYALGANSVLHQQMADAHRAFYHLRSR